MTDFIKAKSVKFIWLYQNIFLQQRILPTVLSNLQQRSSAADQYSGQIQDTN